MNRELQTIAAFIGLALIAGPAAAQQAGPPAVLLQGLDKITARISTF